MGCDAIDLYAARCSVINTYGSESSLSKAGKADEIFYSWGNANPEDLSQIITQTSVPQKRVLHIDTLAAAFTSGVTKFLQELDNDVEKHNLVVRRAGKLFKNLSKEFWR